MNARWLSLVTVVVALGGCAVGPDYQRPAALKAQAVPAAFSTAAATNGGDWKVAAPAAHLPRGEWWSIFGDAELNQLETFAADNNQTLAASLAAFAAARGEFNIARADFLPKLNANGSITRQRTSANAPENGRPANRSYTYTTFAAPLELGWEVDLWGRVRRQVEAGRAQLNAAADDLAAMRLLIQAEIATDYFALRALDTEQMLVTDTIEAYRRSLELTRNRRQGGIVSDLDVAQAETQLRTAEAELPAIELQRVRLLHALAVLCGQAAPEFAIAPAPVATNAIPVLPVSLPSELLERRPDIAAAERRMAAANAQVGVSTAAFYPRIRFNGLAGLQSVDASTFFDWPSRFWSVGPSLSLPIFTGGYNRGQLVVAKANYEATVANYRQTVLSAFAEVEDGLATQRLVGNQLNAGGAALAAARHALEIANNRYKAGLITYLEVATAQSAALERERTVTQLQGQRLAAMVSLIKALGGGWVADEKRLTQQR